MTYFILSLFFTLIYGIIAYFSYKVDDEKMTQKRWIWLAARALFIGGFFHVFNYLFTPTIAYNTLALYGELVAVAVAALAIESFHVCDFWDGKMGTYTVYGGLGLIIIVLGLCTYQWDFFYSDSKQKMLNPTEITIETTDSIVAATDVKNLCTVSEEVARKAIMVQMGDLKNTYEIGSLTKQSCTCDFEATLSNGKKV